MACWRASSPTNDLPTNVCRAPHVFLDHRYRNLGVLDFCARREDR